MLRRIGALLTLPPALAHEAAHAAAAAPWAETVSIHIDAEGFDAFCGVEWADEPPTWGLWLAAYAPFILGMLLGVGALVSMLTRGSIPDSPVDWAWTAMLGIWWTIFVFPSAGDRKSTTMEES